MGMSTLFRFNMLSDTNKFLKIALSLLILMICGIYYGKNSNQAASNINSFGLSGYTTSKDRVCISNGKIYRDKQTFWIVWRHNKIVVINPPEFLEKNLNEELIISGVLTKENRLYIENVHKQNPRYLKLACSGITAIIICPLFFMFFKITKKGFLLRRID